MDDSGSRAYFVLCMDCYGEDNEGDIAGPVADRDSLLEIAAEHARLPVTYDWLAKVREQVPDDLAVVQVAAGEGAGWAVYDIGTTGNHGARSGTYGDPGDAEEALLRLRRTHPR